MPNSYDAVMMMAMAVEKAGSADRGKIAAALREVANAPGEIILPGEWAKAKKLILAEGKDDVHYVGAAGPQDFDENGDVQSVRSPRTRSINGEWAAGVDQVSNSRTLFEFRNAGLRPRVLRLEPSVVQFGSLEGR